MHHGGPWCSAAPPLPTEQFYGGINGAESTFPYDVSGDLGVPSARSSFEQADTATGGLMAASR